MKNKLRTAVVDCQQRSRSVEVTYQRLGPWYAPQYDIVSCPAINDKGGACQRSCQNLINRPFIGLERTVLSYHHQ